MTKADYNPTDLDADKERTKKRNSAKQTDLEIERNDIRWLMDHQPGRRIVWKQLTAAGVFRSSYNTNAMQTAFNEGNRNQGLQLLALIHEHCPEQYSVMQKEQKDANDADDGSHNNQ